MTIQSYTPDKKNQLAGLFTAYFPELGEDIPEDILRGKLTDFIHDQHQKGILSISLLLDGTTPVGFSIYQIDTPESDWCKRPGWGFIREFYIAPPHRKKGLGQLLCRNTEQQLSSMGAARLYLTADNAIPFWQSCGYTHTEEISTNGLYYLEK